MVSKGEMWVSTRTASRSHIVKSGQAHIGLITASRSHIKAYLRCKHPATCTDQTTDLFFLTTKISCFLLQVNTGTLVRKLFPRASTSSDLSDTDRKVG